MTSIGATSKKRKLGDELPVGSQRRTQKLPRNLAQEMIRDGQEKMLYASFSLSLPVREMIAKRGYSRLANRKLLDGPKDVVIMCGGHEFQGCGAVLAARCKFFEACLGGSFKVPANRRWTVLFSPG